MASLSLYPQFETNLISNHKVIELFLRLKSAKAHGKSYIKVKPPLIRHLLRNCLLILASWMLFKQSNLVSVGLFSYRVVPEEERVAKYSRLISATLMALRYLTSELPEESNQALEEDYRSMFREKKFWKFSKHKSSMASTL